MFRVVIVRGVEAREIYQRDIGLLRPADLDQDSMIVDKLPGLQELLAKAVSCARLTASFTLVPFLPADCGPTATNCGRTVRIPRKIRTGH
jgi:hypothetical protein